MNSAPSTDQLLLHLRAGGIAALPTDTLPTLAAQPEAAAALWTMKNRPTHKAFILMGAEADQLWQAIGCQPLPAWQQAAACWPGALTLVIPLPQPSAIGQLLNPCNPTTLGLRVPDHGPTRDLLRLSGPLASTSANRSGEPSLLTPADIQSAFPEILVASSSSWNTSSGRASTIAAWQSNRWIELRSGAVAVSDLQLPSAAEPDCQPETR